MADYWICPYCGKFFTSKMYLTIHMATCPGLEPEPEPELEPEPTPTDEELIYQNWLRTGGTGSISYWRSIGSPLYYTPEPEPTGWIQLDSKSIYVLTPALITNWVKLDSRTISVLALVPIEDWVQLDSKEISVVIPPVITEWVQLDSKTISVVIPPKITDWVLLDEASIPIVAIKGEIPWKWIAGIGAAGLAVYAIIRKKPTIERRIARKMIR